MRKGINIALTIAVLIALVVFCFFIQCNIDLYVIIAGFVITVAAIAVSVIQEKQISEIDK